MNASIQYNEIINFVEKNYKQKINLRSINEKSLEIGYKPVAKWDLLNFIPEVSAKLQVVSINNRCVELGYETNKGFEFIINGIVSFVKENIPTGVEIDPTARRVKVYPHKFEKLEKALAFVELTDVVFENDEIKAVLSLK